MKYSKEITEEICKYLRAGNSQKDSAVLAGIGESTYYEWMDNPEFAEPIKKAEQECKSRNIAIIQKAAEKSWQAGAWWLERKYNSEFALKQINELTGKDGEKLTINILGDYLTKAKRNVSTPNAGIERPEPIQGIDLAQKSEKDIDITREDGHRVP